MWIELPSHWIAVLNLAVVLAVHLGFSWAFTRLPASRFRPRSPLFRIRPWEGNGRSYQRFLRIRHWKSLLPDAGPWFDGFAKKSLRSSDPEHLRRFVVETCRGEAAHLAQIAGLLVPVAWNPWPVAAPVMIAYAFASNLPCIVLQRFNRARLERVLEKTETAP